MTEIRERLVLRLVLDGWQPDARLSLNGRRRNQWPVVRRLQQEAKDYVGWRVLWGWALGQVASEATGPRHVTVTFVYPNRRRRDLDNLAGMAKPCLDALVDAGLLVDDDAEHCALTIAVRVEVGRRATEIRVVEVE